MNEALPYRIIIIGSNHLNTLSAIRALGENHCDIFVLLHTKQKLDMLCCANTKFSKEKTAVISPTEDAIIEWLKMNRRSSKQILFPCSDLAAYVIGNNYNLLVKDYFLLGFNNTPDRICSFMDKWEQKVFAENYGISMPETWKLSCDDNFNIPANISFPCIAKPRISAFGSKSDITICFNSDELLQAVNRIGKNNIIIQEYLVATNEYGVMGCILNNKEDCVVNTIRRIYDLSGNTVYAIFEDNPLIDKQNKIIINALHSIGYRGMFDFDFIISNDSAYLIEMNFRHSGVGFGLSGHKVYAQYLSCVDICGINKKNYSLRRKVKEGSYLMDETVCFNHRKEFGISFFKWLLMCFRKCSLAKFDIHDLKGSFFIYRQILHK